MFRTKAWGESGRTELELVRDSGAEDPAMRWAAIVGLLALSADELSCYGFLAVVGSRDDPDELVRTTAMEGLNRISKELGMSLERLITLARREAERRGRSS